MLIEGRRIGPAEPVYVVAELGVNHNGDPLIAGELLAAAKEAGADAAKLQLFVPEELASEHAGLCDYQRAASAGDQRDLLRSLVLPAESLEILKEEAARRGITLFASVFDAPSLAQALRLDFAAIKLGSGELTCLPLNEEVCRTGKPTILSCGMATAGEVAPAVALYKDAGTPVILLHCVSAYPAPEAELNLRSIPFLARRFGVPVGFSDHTEGTRAACLAVACGAVLIEKHLTLDRDLPGPDHRASAEPAEFARLVREIRETEAMLGIDDKVVAAAERETRDKARKSIVLARAVAAGTRIEREDLAFRRPGTGISPIDLAAVVGRAAARALPAGHMLAQEDIVP